MRKIILLLTITLGMSASAQESNIITKYMSASNQKMTQQVAASLAIGFYAQVSLYGLKPIKGPEVTPDDLLDVDKIDKVSILEIDGDVVGVIDLNNYSTMYVIYGRDFVEINGVWTNTDE